MSLVVLLDTVNMHACTSIRSYYIIVVHHFIKIHILYYNILTEPSEPEGLKAEQKDIINTTVTLSWKPPNPFNGSISEYIMEYKVINSFEPAVIKSAVNTECEVTGLIADKQYEFKVAAVNKAGRGPFTKPCSLHST